MTTRARSPEQIFETAAWAVRTLRPEDMDGISAQNFAYDIVVLKAERDRLREFVVAHTLLDKGIVDFDLHREAVERFERASEAVADVIREALTEPGPKGQRE